MKSKKIIEFKKEIKFLSNKKRAKNSQRFFKTGSGEYGEGDVFLGIKTPIQRKIAKKYNDFNFQELKELLKSNIHCYRFIALIILIDKFGKSKEKEKKKIFNFYLKNIKGINNWDLVDISAPKILGNYLLNKNKNLLFLLAKSKNLWKKRIAIISTYQFIENNLFQPTFKIAELLLHDEHDLIHKAVGWMLREVGNRNQETEEIFLKKYVNFMPRTMLRYAIEKFSKNKRIFYLSQKQIKFDEK